MNDAGDDSPPAGHPSATLPRMVTVEIPTTQGERGELSGSDTAPSAGVRRRGQPTASGPDSGADGGPQSHAPGTTIGHYEVIRPLGQGGMGEVYLARDMRLGRRVALKFLLDVDSPHSARFLVEARATAQLTHENIVALYDLGRAPGVAVHGAGVRPGEDPGGLAARAPRGRRPEPQRRGPRRARGGADAAGGAGARLRARGGDRAPGSQAREHHADRERRGEGARSSGIAKLLTEAEAPAGPPGGGGADAVGSALTRRGAVVGTIEYMSPEQWGEDVVDARADLWAVGIVLYEMVTGEHPLAPLSMQSLSTVPSLDEPMPSVRERLPGIGKLAAIVDRCLIKRKADRLGSAAELIAELDGRRPPGPERGARGARRAQPLRGPRGVPGGRRGALLRPRAGRRGGGGAPRRAAAARRRGPVRRGQVVAGARRGHPGAQARRRRLGDVRPPPGRRARSRSLALHLLESRVGHSTRRRAPPVDERDALCEQLRREPGLVGVELRARARRRLERVLLFVDQFEELVTLAPEDERAAFVACLAGVADDASSPLRVMVAVRQDFLDRVAANQRGARGADEPRRGPGRADGPRRPAQRAGSSRRSCWGTASRPRRWWTRCWRSSAAPAGALPLLQFTASRLWEGRDRERRLLTEASYRAFGGVGGALASHADSVLDGLSPAERRWARVLLLRLVTPERTRAVVDTARSGRARRRHGGGDRARCSSGSSTRGWSRWRAPAGTRARSSWCTSRSSTSWPALVALARRRAGRRAPPRAAARGGQGVGGERRRRGAPLARRGGRGGPALARAAGPGGRGGARARARRATSPRWRR